MFIVEINFMDDLWAHTYHDVDKEKQPAVYKTKADAVHFVNNLKKLNPNINYRIRHGSFTAISTVYNTDGE